MDDYIFYAASMVAIKLGFTVAVCVIVLRTHKQTPLLTPFLALFYFVDLIRTTEVLIGASSLFEIFPWFYYAGAPFYFFAPAAIYWHCRSVTLGGHSWKRHDFIWFVIPLAIIPLWISFFFLDKTAYLAVKNLQPDGQSFGVQLIILTIQSLFVLYRVVYIFVYIAILKLVRKRAENLRGFFSDDVSIVNYSLRRLLAPLAFLLLHTVSVDILVKFIPENPTTAEFLLFNIFPDILWLLATFQMAIVPIILGFGAVGKNIPNEFPLSMEENKDIKTNKLKYSKSMLDAKDLKALAIRIARAMKVEKLYLDSTLTLSTMARHLNVPSHHLTQCLNQEIGQKFFDYVNSWRVIEAKRLLDDPNMRKVNIINLAYAAGFNSKSTFNLAFKKHVGQTPTQYRSRSKTGDSDT